MRLLLFVLAFFSAAPAFACSIPPPGPDPEPPIVWQARYALIEIVALESADHPDIARVRVRSVRWGPYSRGQIVRVRPEESSMCGPDEIKRGDRGFIIIDKRPWARTPIIFEGFVDPERVKRR